MHFGEFKLATAWLVWEYECKACYSSKVRSVVCADENMDVEQKKADVGQDSAAHGAGEVIAHCNLHLITLAE